VIEDTSRVAQWLQLGQRAIAQLPWRHTGLRLAITDPAGQIRYFAPAESLPGTGGAGEVAWQGHIELPHCITSPPRQGYRSWVRHQNRLADNVGRVALDQWVRFREPILVLASTRAQTRVIAQKVGAALEGIGEGEEASQLACRIGVRFPYLHTLQECLRHGVAYHNASLPDWVRRQLEVLIQRRQLRVVIATTTLAERVDLPFRVAVLADWRQWLFGRLQPMPTLLFRNIAGRCGRAWEFVEGDTIIVDTPAQEYADEVSRSQEYARLYIDPPPYSLHSSVEKALQSGDQPSLADARSGLESQFTAHVAVRNSSET
jgi:helicase